jgi:hypothetical protein
MKAPGAIPALFFKFGLSPAGAFLVMQKQSNLDSEGQRQC